MTIEIRVLVLSACIGLIHILAAAMASTLQRGTAWNLSSRDETPKPLTGVAGRLSRAQSNFFETFPIFLAAVVALRFADVSNGLTVTGAWLYLISRVLYLPIYALGINLVRTLVWAVGLIGVVILLASGVMAIIAMMAT